MDNDSFGGLLYPHGMTVKTDPWPERARYRDLVDQWMHERAGKTRSELWEAFAQEVGSTPEYLRQLYSGKVKAPGRELLKRLAEVLGCPPGDLLQDSSAPIFDMAAEDMAAYTVEEQFDMRALGTNLKRLAPDARARVIKAWRAVLESSVPTKATIEMEVKRRGKG